MFHHLVSVLLTEQSFLTVGVGRNILGGAMKKFRLAKGRGEVSNKKHDEIFTQNTKLTVQLCKLQYQTEIIENIRYKDIVNFISSVVGGIYIQSEPAPVPRLLHSLTKPSVFYMFT